MAGKENYIIVAICPWCGCSMANRDPLVWVKCDECGNRFSCDPIMVTQVPERSMGMKNRNIGKLVKVENVKPKFAWSSCVDTYMPEGYEKISLCPWCGCAMTGLGLPAANRFECVECGARPHFRWGVISIAEKTKGMRDMNFGKEAQRPGPKIESYAHASKQKNIWIVCPWCREAYARPYNDMLICKQCGARFNPQVTASIVPADALAKKDKFRGTHH